MGNKKWWFLLVFILFIPIVYAQYYPWDGYGSGFGGDPDIFYIYSEYYLIIDFLLYFMIFLNVIKSVFTKQEFYGKSEGNLVSLALALFLSFGMVRWEAERGYSLGQFGVVGALILSILIITFIYKLVSKLGREKWVAVVWSYIIVYAFLAIFLGNEFGTYLAGTGWLSLLNLIFVVCLVLGIFAILNIFTGTPPAAGAGHGP